ncbi:MAG: potassium channel family protein [Actinomycetota bacterium]|nr:potassium channel family protein [Actinomycetota bacterium]
MRTILRLINEVSLTRLLLTLLGITVGFGFLYWGLERAMPGTLVFTYYNGASPGIGDALYFSVVTLTSLGYGDIRPDGIARLIAGVEVVLGLSFFGVIVAKISSVKQDYILRRMYYADLIDRRLSEYVEKLDEYRKLYRITSNMLLDGEIDPELTTTFKAEVAETTLFYQVHSLLHEIRDMVVFETHNGGFFGDVSDALVSRIYASMQSMMRHTLALTERDPQGALEHVLYGNQRQIAELTQVAEELAALCRKGSRNTELIEQCDSLVALAARMRAEVLPLLASVT